MKGVGESDELIQLIPALGPLHLYIIYVSKPAEGFERGLTEETLFKIALEDICIRGRHLCSHRGTVNLEVVLSVEHKVV